MATNGNRGWYKADTHKADMGKWGREDLYVVTKDINSLPYQEGIRISKKMQGLDIDPNSVDVDSPQITAMMEEIINLIVEWNMEDPFTGKPMARPKTAKDLFTLPMDVITHIMQSAVPADADEGVVPLKSETEQGATPKA